MSLPAPALLVITDRRRTTRPLIEVIAAAIAGGACWISLREKDLPAAERLDLLRSLKALTDLTATRLMVHDDLDAAAALGLAGIHLPGGGDPRPARDRLGPAALIGVSAHDLASAEAAARHGADYVTLSPIFASPSKPGYGPALGLDRLAAICRAVACPILALGGIDEAARLAACLEVGAAGAAVMGAVMAARDPMAATRDMILGFGDARPPVFQPVGRPASSSD